MATRFLEPGTSSTFDLSLWTTSAGATAPISDTSNTNGQQRSLKCAGATGASGRSSNVTQNGGAGVNGRASFGFVFDHLASGFAGGTLAQNDRILQLRVAAGGAAIALSVDTSGHLNLLDAAAPATRATGTATLAINTHYRICIAWTISSTTVNEFRVYLAVGDAASVLDITTTNITIGSAAPDQLALGMSQWDCTSSAVNCWFTDVYADDSSALTDTGNIHVTPKRPFANGANNDFTTQIGSGGSGYGSGHAPQVNERPASQTNGWSFINAGGTQSNQNYVIEGASVGDVNITGCPIIDVMAWIIAKALVSETGTLYSGPATISVALTGTPTTFILIDGRTSYPVANQVGLQTAATLTTVSLYEAGIVIAYTATSQGKPLVNAGLVNHGLVNQNGLVQA